MKKRLILTVVMALTLVLCLTSCDLIDSIIGGGGDIDPITYTVTFDSNGGSAVGSVTVTEGEGVTKPTDPTKDDNTFLGWFKDSDLTEEWSFDTDKVASDITLYARWMKNPQPTPETYTVTFDSNGGSAVGSVTVTEGETVAKPQAPTREDYTFEGWYKNSDLTEEWSFDSDKVTENVTLYAKWKPKFEKVTYSLNVTDLTAQKLTSDLINGKYTVLSGTEIRNRTKNWTDSVTGEKITFERSVKLGSNDSAIKVSVPASGTLAFWIQNGSSGAATQFVKITDPDGVSKEMEFDGTNNSSPVVKLEIEVTEGEWTIQRKSGTVDVFMLELTCLLETSEECGFELVATGNVDYLVGDTLDLSSLVLNARFENGKTNPLAVASVKADTSAVDTSKAGVYTVKLSYKDYESIDFTVNVYEPKKMTLGFDSIEKLATNSAAGNGVYFNHSFREVYNVGDSLSTSGLSVTVTGELPSGAKKDFIVSMDKVGVKGFDSSAAGEQQLTVYYGGLKVSVSVYVVSVAPEKSGDTYRVYVNKNYQGVIGAASDGYNRFTTVQQALDYLASRPEIKDSDKKLIVIGEGKFEEKLEITIPNLTIEGAGKDKTLIEWDSLYGLCDASGFAHVTDSTATVAIRDDATDCVIKNLTISNAYNSKAYFDKTLGEGYGEHRALALLVQADRFTMKDGGLLGYQDTVELFTGRQLFEGVYIQGTTDFIFGTNNTTLFKSCTIHSITTGKTDGGYITAFKGLNKSADKDSVTYGAIFYQCSFTADEDVLENKNTAIGRTWDKCAAVAVIECDLGAHVSTKGFSGSSKNERYVNMNAKPTDSTVQFREYGNTGAGAITSEVAGMKLLTADEAAKYTDVSVIFGTTNGKVTYESAWEI